ncbi:isochorismate synthase [Tenacibaculum sp. SG-28]|uniref:isochorismate synthase n=1 Tax=Tenacibaculum sp. SG-28 TaxID=754426 RepID=UPI000CF403D7|nr:isochorismate synthase [Tenacibaculum sp. SG-28]PQJ20756.1 hypothetical protein BSU00_10740 [Tenacibaculum sp. SG-28]
MSIFKQIKTALHNQLPFVAYRKPNKEEIIGIFQANKNLYTSEKLTEDGFVFAPFDTSEKTIIIPLQKAILLRETNLEFEVEESKSIFESAPSIPAEYKATISKAIVAINNGDFSKVVLSRKENIQLNHTNALTIFKKLLKKHTEAMVYLWFHPSVGLWIGATPETLVTLKDSFFETMALAGTQVFQKNTEVEWKNKEIEEQKFVTDYLIEQLQPITTNISKTPTKTIKAGNLLHLQTKITGVLNTPLYSFVQKIHPTPAVCGLPKEVTKAFILDNENYKRKFYTGFLGEVNVTKKQSELFVNLRCMELDNGVVSVYVGGGITKDSDPNKEWEETIAKSKTMKSVL